MDKQMDYISATASGLIIWLWKLDWNEAN